MSPNNMKKLKPMPMLENTQDPGISGLMMHKEMKEKIPMPKAGPQIAPAERSSGIGGMIGGSGSRQDVDEK